MTEPHELATSFGAAADSYDRARPSYPPEVVDWILQSRPQGIVDLGAGTGILTRLIADRARVVAVDPDAAMLAKIGLPQVRTVVGSGESIPLPDDSADLIVAAQAWHWVDPVRAVPELVRVLRPGGWAAMVWYRRDHSDPWAAALREVLSDAPGEKAADQAPDLGDAFGPVESFEVRWRRPMTRPELLDMVHSRSSFITAPEPEQQRLLGAVTGFLDDSGAGEHFELAYRTIAYRAQLLT